MYAYIARVRAKGRLYEYLQVCETVRRNGKPTRRTLGSLGRLDRLDPHKVDGLIRGLRRFADAEAAPGVRPAAAPILATRLLGPIQVARRLWEDLGLPQLLPQGQQGFPVEEVLFRLVANRLVAPQSKRATVAWQHAVEWSERRAYGYDDFLRAMDVLQQHQTAVEEALFGRIRQLFSTPLRLVWYDLTSTYFEGDGVCKLAAYGHSRDHRSDRAQVVLGLALTQEGYPIAHHVFPGNTADVTTVAQLAKQLKERFGLPEAIVVGDRGLLSAANAQALDELELGYVLALRTRQQRQAGQAVDAALAAGLERPRDPQAPWTVQEVAAVAGQRQVVVYSAFRALHDRMVRRRRLVQTRDGLRRLQAQVVAGRLTEARRITERATRLLSRSKVSRFFTWTLAAGRFHFQLDRAVYRAQRRLDGMYVLVSNDPQLPTAEIVAAYRQLHRVEEAFRLLKSLVKLRPLYHWTARRVEAHIFICVLAYLLATRLEQRLAQAGLDLSAARALQQLEDVRAVDQQWGEVVLTHRTRPSPEAQAILRAFDLPADATILRTTPLSAA
jgi:transposase